MSSVGFYALGNAWLFGLLAPLVLFYFLKLKRPRVIVSSLALWRQVIADKRVNSPFQRFKRNILLLLQILLLLLLIAAALQPFLRSGPHRSLRIPVLVDCSASMAALDKEGGTSRLDAARKRVAEMIDGLAPDQEMCLVSFSNGAKKRADFTDNKRLLHEALKGIRVEDVPSDVEEALRMTEALRRTTPFDEVLLLSDGNFPARTQFQLSFRTLNYQRLPAAGPNFGITSLNGRRWSTGGWDVFVCVEGSADAEGAVTVEVSRDGQPIGTERVFVRKGKEQRIVFRVGGERASDLEVRLVPENFDSLASDNVAFLHLPALRRLQVYVSPALAAYRHALRPLEGVSVQPEDEPQPRESAYDLVITDREEDLKLEAGTRFCVGIIPGDLGQLLTVTKDAGTVVDWDRSAPLLRHVELGEVVILEQPRSNAGVAESDYENAGYEVLVHGQRGPLLVSKRQEDRVSLYQTFHSDRSTLPYRVGFPVLVSNLVQVAMQQAGLAEAGGRRTGVLGDVVLKPGRSYVFEGPDGQTRQQASDEAGVVSGVPALRVGYYRISEGGREQARVGAALLAADETRLEGTEKIAFAEDISVAASQKKLKSDRPLWPRLALLALCVLMAEWWYFQRGAGGGAA